MTPESVPGYWRQIRDGCTRALNAKPVAELPNPGTVYEFHSQLYKKNEEGKLVSCSPEETRKAKRGCTAPRN